MITLALGACGSDMALDGGALLLSSQQAVTTQTSQSPQESGSSIDLDDVPAVAADVGRSSAEPLSPATALAPNANIVESFAVTLGINPDAGAAESICPGAGPIEDVEAFAGTAAFDRARITGIARATVRISVQPQVQLQRSIGELSEAAAIDQGAFTGFEAWNRGFCTGTLITRNIVLTAGHCISPRFWQDERKVRVPVVRDRRGSSRPIRATELARLMQVEFNFQHRYLAETGTFQFASQRDDYLTARVTEVISADYRRETTSRAVDYALLRIETADDDRRRYLEETALGLGRLKYTPPARHDPIAIIQHPGGFEKKIATGQMFALRDWRLYYNDVSTEGGSSGAGVFDAAGRLVAIHTRGGCAAASGANKGMSLQRLKDVIAALRDPTT